MRIIWLIFLAALALRCNDPGNGSIDPAQRVMPDQEGWNARFTVSEDGKRRIEVHYGHMMKYARKGQIHFDGGITVHFFDKQGDSTSVLIADQGIMYEAKNDFEAAGHVVVTSRDGRTLRSEKLRWDEARQKILSDTFVTITTLDGDSLIGEGFESDQNLQAWKILKPRGLTGKIFSVDELEHQPAGDDSLRRRLP